MYLKGEINTTTQKIIWLSRIAKYADGKSKNNYSREMLVSRRKHCNEDLWGSVSVRQLPT